MLMPSLTAEDTLLTMDETLQQYHALKLAQARLEVVLGSGGYEPPGGLVLVSELLRLAERDPPLPEARLREIYRGLSYDYAQAEADLAPRVDGLRARGGALRRRAQTHGQCAICLDEDVVLVFALAPIKTDSFEHATCHHRFCHPCLAQYVRTAVDAQRWVVPCPSSDCARRLTETDIARLCGTDAGLLAQRREHLIAGHCGLSEEHLLCMPYYATCKECDAENEVTMSVAQALHEGEANEGSFTRNATCCLTRTPIVFHSRDSQGIHPCPGCNVLASRFGGCDTVACPCGTTFEWGSWEITESHSEYATVSEPTRPPRPAPGPWQAIEQALDQAADVSSVQQQQWEVGQAQVHMTRPIAKSATVQALLGEVAAMLEAATDLPALCGTLTRLAAAVCGQSISGKVALAMEDVLSTISGRHVLLVKDAMDTGALASRIEAAVQAKATSVVRGATSDVAADGTLVVWILEGIRGVMVAVTPGGKALSSITAELRYDLCCTPRITGSRGSTVWMVV